MAVTERRLGSRPAATKRLAHVVFTPVWVVFALVALLSAAGVTLPTPYRYGLLVASALFLGLPHGAFDHLTIPRARGVSLSVRSLAGIGLLYAVLGGAYALVWFVAPDLAFVGFLLLTWVHWGLGDVFPLVELVERTHLTRRSQRFLTAAVRGGIPMLVPLLAAPAEYRLVTEGVVGLFAPGTTLDWLFSTDVRAALGVGFVLLTGAALTAGRVGVSDSATRAAWRLDVTETALLWLFFAAVPPLFAIGLYFPLWHSVRHLVRVALLDPTTTEAVAAGRVRAALARLARDAAPMTAGGLVVFGLLALAVPSGVGTLDELASAYLVVLAVLTLPHVVVVSWMDRIQFVW